MILVLMAAVESGKGDKVLFSYWCHTFAAGHYYKTLWFLSDFNHLFNNIFRNLLQKKHLWGVFGFFLVILLSFLLGFFAFKPQLELSKFNILKTKRYFRPSLKSSLFSVWLPYFSCKCFGLNA